MTLQSGGNQLPPETPRTCPFLGLSDDEQTALAFPSDWNSCHHCKPVSAVKLDHQRIYCLSPNHIKCIVYLQPADNALPREIRSRQPHRMPMGAWFWKITLPLVFLALMIVLGAFYSTEIRSFLPMGFLEAPGFLQPSAVPTWLPVFVTPSPEPTFTLTPVKLPSATATPRPTLFIDDPNLTPSSSLLATATITRIPRDIETLIGINYIFKIHRVRHGESLELLAYSNGTTIAAIFAVNYKFSAPIWVQQVMILPVNQTDVSDLPPFEPYRVTEDMSLEDLATELQADPDQIQFYNGLGTSEQLSQGEWIIVPREKEQTE